MSNVKEEPYVPTSSEAEQLRKFLRGEMTAAEVQKVSTKAQAVFAAIGLATVLESRGEQDIQTPNRLIVELLGVTNGRADYLRMMLSEWGIAQHNGKRGMATRTSIVLPDSYRQLLDSAPDGAAPADSQVSQAPPVSSVSTVVPADLERKLGILIGDDALLQAVMAAPPGLLEEARNFAKRYGPLELEQFRQLVQFFARQSQ